MSGEWQRIVYATIYAVREGLVIKPVQEAIRKAIRRYKLESTRYDKKISGIVYNVFRNQGLLEKIIYDLSGININDLPRELKAPLYVLAYVSQLDNKSSKTTKRTFKRYITRYIFTYTKEKELLSRINETIKIIYEKKWEPQTFEDKILLRYKISPQLYNALEKALRELQENIEEFFDKTMKIEYRVFRVNKLKASVDAIINYLSSFGYIVERGKYSPQAIRVKGSLGKEIIKLVETGILVPQDESSMVAVEILSPRPGSKIADLCAAPGGKTTYLAEITNLKSEIHSFEIYKDRAKRLRLLLERTGTNNVVRIYIEDARKAPLILGNETMDYVLVDPPCSSTGALARNPDVRWRYRQEDVEKLSTLQYEILVAGWKILKKKGRLLYTVCSVLPLEGEYVIKKFIEEHKDAKLIDLGKPFKKSPILPQTMRAWPHIHRTIGFYYALLEKNPWRGRQRPSLPH